jgi:hypothetical protein
MNVENPQDSQDQMILNSVSSSMQFTVSFIIDVFSICLPAEPHCSTFVHLKMDEKERKKKNKSV